jgi:dihydrofolate reductase
MDKARVIGVRGQLPWHLPNDLRRFKQLTMGKPIIMGRKTFESIGKPLPGRKNIVLTRNIKFCVHGVDCHQSLHSALTSLEDEDEEGEIFVIGGGMIYKEALPYAQTIYLTEVMTILGGDAYFPELALSEWKEISSELCNGDTEHAYSYCFRHLEKIV